MKTPIYLEDAIDAVLKRLCVKSEEYLTQSERCVIDILKELPSAEPDSCEGCEWEDAFGYGECHHCKRNFDDMYEVKEG